MIDKMYKTQNMFKRFYCKSTKKLANFAALYFVIDKFAIIECFHYEPFKFW